MAWSASVATKDTLFYTQITGAVPQNALNEYHADQEGLPKFKQTPVAQRELIYASQALNACHICMGILFLTALHQVLCPCCVLTKDLQSVIRDQIDDGPLMTLFYSHVTIFNCGLGKGEKPFSQTIETFTMKSCALVLQGFRRIFCCSLHCNRC
jgi:hypothetical protein